MGPGPDTELFRELLATIRRDFNIPKSSELVLSYIDNEKDKVTMVGDDDIRDAFLLQKLNPVRVSVVVAQGPEANRKKRTLRSSQSCRIVLHAKR